MFFKIKAGNGMERKMKQTVIISTSHPEDVDAESVEVELEGGSLCYCEGYIWLNGQIYCITEKRGNYNIERGLP